MIDGIKTTKLVTLPWTEPEKNLASEEVFFRHRQGNCVFIWRNAPCVVVGKNQNPYAEADISYADSAGIKIVRRITGGGAVYHDLENVNFTFIGSGSSGMFEKMNVIAEFLREEYLSDVTVSGRNDLMSQGLKISGCAEIRNENRYLIHGTLMVRVDGDTLAKVLRPNKLKLQSKGIASVRKRVGNISELSRKPCTAEEMMEKLTGFFLRTCEEYRLTPEDEEEIEALAQSKFRTFEWIFGKNAAFGFEKTGRVGSAWVTVGADVSDGIIKKIRISGDFFGDRDIRELEYILTGIKFSPAGVRAALADTDLALYLGDCGKEEFSRLFG